jgi:hypothetical protein
MNIGTQLWGGSSLDQPVTHKNLEAAAEKLCPSRLFKSRVQPRGYLSDALGLHRKAYSNAHVVDDEGAIPKSLKLGRRLSCPELHPGVCQHVDATYYANLCSAASNIADMFLRGDGSDVRVGDFCLIRAYWADGAKRDLFYRLSHRKKQKPKRCIWACCSILMAGQGGQDRYVAMDGAAEGRAFFVVSHKALLPIFRCNHAGGALTKIEAYTLNIAGLHRPGPIIAARARWQSFDVNLLGEIWPNFRQCIEVVARQPASTPAVGSIMHILQAGMTSLETSCPTNGSVHDDLVSSNAPRMMIR